MEVDSNDHKPLTGGASIERANDLLDTAEEEVVYMTSSAAGGRGTTIRLAGFPLDVKERIATEIPAAEAYDVPWRWASTGIGRLLMVDRETLRVSALTNGWSPGETAIWGSGEHNSLVVVLRAIFAWWLEDSDRYPDD